MGTYYYGWNMSINKKHKAIKKYYNRQSKNRITYFIRISVTQHIYNVFIIIRYLYNYGRNPFKKCM